jgi:putative membrane protein
MNGTDVQLTSDARLGGGSESEIYALDDEHVLRLYYGGSEAYLAQRQRFYEWLQHMGLPFETPHVLETGRRGDRYYSIERRMQGRDFSQVLPTLQEDERRKALTSYLDVAAQIGAVQLPEQPFGEVMMPDAPIRRERWGDYLQARMEHTLAASRPDLETDVPNLVAVLAHIDNQLQQVTGWQEKRLVHGDYFPGNVFIDHALRICGVGDFGYSTVVGDPRMDLAGAVVFLEVVAAYRPEDTTLLLEQVASWWGEEMVAIVDVYRLYYSIYFSRCKRDDPTTYWWCVRNLRAI